MPARREAVLTQEELRVVRQMISEYDYRQRRGVDDRERSKDQRGVLLASVAIATVLIQLAELYLITHGHQAQSLASGVGVALRASWRVVTWQT